MRLRNILLPLILSFFVSCGGKTQQPYLTNPPVAGTPETFLVGIQNNSLWDINVGYAINLTTGQTGYLIIPSGSHVVFDVGFLPSSVTVSATTTGIPPVSYPAKTKTLGQDYAPTATALSFGFPYP